MRDASDVIIQDFLFLSSIEQPMESGVEDEHLSEHALHVFFRAFLGLHLSAYHGVIYNYNGNNHEFH